MGVTVHSSLADLPKPVASEAPEIWFEGQFIALTNPTDYDWVQRAIYTPYFETLTKLVLG
jgi:hypothetical protein